MNRADETEEAIFNAAQLLQDSAKQHAYLDLACDGDPDLRQRMERLLASSSGAEDFFKRNAAGVPHVPVPHDATFANPISEGPNSVIGRYKLSEKIGEGGMGVVYLAEQEQPVRRKVALKIIKLGMDTRQVVARFEAERQALALMDHPNIAKVLDGGATENGRPFFVMELVQGVPITRFCDENRLSTEDRLKLFLPVCQAIQSAHQKGIIHRDIKPSNVLVTLNNDVPQPMVIDFGVAKATNQKLTEKTLFTNFTTMIGTPAYMSPEQAEMSKLDVDTRSDIYSLGVLLYELLTSTTPFPEKRLRSVAYREMQRIIAQEQPERPSKVVERLSKLRVERGEAPAPRGSFTLNSQLKSLSTDLDWIVMKCLEKDRNRRYETANGLASDINRFLDNEPVMARPPSTVYRFQKTIRRNKLAFASAAVVSLSLVAGIAVSFWQAARAERERARAERRLQASLKFIDQVFDSVSPDVNTLIGGANANRSLAESGLELMDEFRKDAGSPSKKFRLVLAQLQTQMGFTQGWPVGNTTGDYEGGLKSATEAIALLQPSRAESLDDEGMNRLVRAEMVAGYASLALRRYNESLSHFQQMEHWASRLALSTSNHWSASGKELKQWAGCCIGEVMVQTGWANAQRAIDERFLPQLREFRERFGSNAPTDFRAKLGLRAVTDDLGVAYSKLGKPDEALPYFREANDLVGRIVAERPNNADVAQLWVEGGAKLGEALLTLGQSEEGLRLLDEALTRAESLTTRDPKNSGFAQLRIDVLRRYVLGMAAWSTDTSSTAAERHQLLEKAQAYLNRAESLLAALPTESARDFLRPDLEQADLKVVEARAKLGASPAAQERGTP